MKKLSVATIALICAAHFVGCESIGQPPPPVTAEMTTDGNVARLNQGRTVFVSRCIECHTLPPVWHYTAGEWPRLVDSMAHRAHLKSEERDAVVAYILTVRKH